MRKENKAVLRIYQRILRWRIKGSWGEEFQHVPAAVYSMPWGWCGLLRWGVGVASDKVPDPHLMLIASVALCSVLLGKENAGIKICCTKLLWINSPTDDCYRFQFVVCCGVVVCATWTGNRSIRNYCTERPRFIIFNYLMEHLLFSSDTLDVAVCTKKKKKKIEREKNKENACGWLAPDNYLNTNNYCWLTSLELIRVETCLAEEKEERNKWVNPV